MLDLTRRRPDVRAYVASLEEWIIRTLASFEVCAERRHDRVGVWVARSDKGAGCEDKIAAIGVRLRRWVSFHGISINVEPNLSHFEAIVPCGVSDARFGVTSLADLGRPIPMAEVDLALRRTFPGGVRPDGRTGAARVGLTCTALSVWPVGGSGRVPRVRMLRGLLLALSSDLCRIGSAGHATRSQLFALNVVFRFGRLGAVRRYLPDHGLVTQPG